MPFPPHEFAKGLVAALVEADMWDLKFARPSGRQALQGIRAMLDRESADGPDDEWRRCLVRLRNALDPGQDGRFGGFATELADLQMSLVAFDGSGSGRIAFTASPPFAGSLLDAMPDRERGLVRRAAAICKASSLDAAAMIAAG